ncbi:putative membrane protein [Bartonella australis AUST/NH1]|uniref:Putative membrane protein n=1 Tax=Bartonella australis (strain Aust/NH1) TaxID=1094489 RepID=M1N560_BARAA|nr:hypothetical protein [Bartonella australis]AGF74999.1 putative membrane protein [Bartonella australis AUST/NH1]
MSKFITPLLSYLVGEKVKNTVTRIRIQTICYGITGFALFMAVLFLSFAGFISLCSISGPVTAASIMLLIWLFVAGLSVFVGRLLAAYQRHNHRKQLEEQRHKLIQESAFSGVEILSKHLPLAKLGIPALGLATYLLWRRDKKDPS